MSEMHQQSPGIVTDLASAAAAMPQARDGHDALAEAERRMAACAHELRTPIGGMLALADLLLASDLDGAQRRYADALREAADHLLGVTTEILDAAKLRHDGLALAQDRLELRSFFEALLVPHAARGAAKGVSVRLDLGADLPEAVETDRLHLRRVLDNLLDNALKATMRGEITLVLRACATPDLRLLIRVEDTGPGLGPEPARLFEPFVQGPGARGGTGLGLALVAATIEAMGGRIAAENRPEGGAAISIELPARVAAAAAAKARPDGVCAAPGASLRILVAEDNAANRIVLGSILEEFGHQHRMVGRGNAAIDAVRSGEVDLVLMDSLLPGVSGPDAIQAIRCIGGRCGRVPIIGMTASHNARDLEVLRHAGADAVITKPLSVRELWRAIETVRADRLADGADRPPKVA